MPREGGRPLFGPPELLELARVGIGVPEPFHRDGIVGNYSEGERPRIGRNGRDRHRLLLFGTRLSEYRVELTEAGPPQALELDEQLPRAGKACRVSVHDA